MINYYTEIIDDYQFEMFIQNSAVLLGRRLTQECQERRSPPGLQITGLGS